MEADAQALATRQDLKDAIEPLKNAIEPLTQDLAMLRTEMSHQYDDLKESIRDVQTELLKAFYNYGQTNDLKMKDLENADFSFRQRLSVAEARITELERRINTPPPSN